MVNCGEKMGARHMKTMFMKHVSQCGLFQWRKIRGVECHQPTERGKKGKGITRIAMLASGQAFGTASSARDKGVRPQVIEGAPAGERSKGEESKPRSPSGMSLEKSAAYSRRRGQTGKRQRKYSEKKETRPYAKKRNLFGRITATGLI